MTANDTLLTIAILLLAFGQLILIIIGVVLLVRIQKITRNVHQITSDGRWLVEEAVSRMKRGKSVLGTGMWLLNKVKKGARHE